MLSILKEYTENIAITAESGSLVVTNLWFAVFVKKNFKLSKIAPFSVFIFFFFLKLLDKQYYKMIPQCWVIIYIQNF